MRAQATTARAPAAEGVDRLLLGTIVLLVGIGAVAVYSASAVTAATRFHDSFHFLDRQLVAVGLGLALLVAGLAAGYGRAERLAYPVLAATVVALVAVLLPFIGHTAGGARRWIDLGVLHFQPAEAAKLALVLYLAHSLARKRDKMRLFSIGFLPHLLVAGALMALCLAEKDLGTCVVMALVLFVMLFAAGAKVSYLLGALLASLPLVYNAVMGTPYRRIRFEAWLRPFEHRRDAGYQMWESMVGIGSGGWFGQGLGQGRSKLFYLPEAHTDFIGAVIAEEAGLVGLGLLILLYALFVWRGLRASFRAADAFGCYLALGITTLVGVQALVNLGVVTVLLPTKGLTLPFVSYGGSSLLTLLAASGLLLSVSASRGGFLKPASQAVRVGAATGEGA
ncbi:putative lipid II flippase FtsW [Anaeromyxobacter diazotrophicus]|uniref:Probable peptidoglycan glycosyltransferase FtsW n=1 Tax=Anaeromyxobacter diazotrophicus TaxID=2590199 RepID=A0A7I9VK51_9BACT|nr:putative lipid II flippase FtsW [Anaeromyxobacter diazotrophicus]GEJ56772.1 putative lipid II flippase FtsW [Anaeromyxobacter diazotrophicus]